ncbi:MAG: hypothetical protein IJO69_06360 [Ruminiclostridium sp.]|nr:hypothetical protein [Ruminiclostridium sp.]
MANVELTLVAVPYFCDSIKEVVVADKAESIDEALNMFWPVYFPRNTSVDEATAIVQDVKDALLCGFNRR